MIKVSRATTCMHLQADPWVALRVVASGAVVEQEDAMWAVVVGVQTAVS